MKVKTLWTLPSTKLTGPDSIVGPTFVTIWLFTSAILAYIFYWLLKKPNPTWPEFKTISLGARLLVFWYLGIVIDRWIHFDNLKVTFGYILFLPILEFFHVGSTVLTLWGTYEIVWKEIEGRFTERHQGIWWFAAKCVNFLVCMVSLFYTILYLALAIVWMEFVSLNIIADVATKRTQFELSMAALFCGFSLLAVSAAAAAIVWGSARIDGKIRKTRMVLFLATVLLLARSISQFVLVVKAYGKGSTGQDVLLAKDVSYGLTSTLYLSSMAFLAWHVSTNFDKGGTDARLVQSDIRKYILDKLQADTKSGRQESPAFEEILAEVSRDLDTILNQGPLSSSSTVSRDQRRVVAQEYIQDLHNDYGKLDPKKGLNYRSLGVRTTSAFSRVFSPISRSAANTPGSVSRAK
ncbi:hypothetical protein EDB81DRAFT_940453 [Dactylonectria macrodidyma]|uniref:Uncharacterized protein n=1 Tax=Dactylonectria macrodidyma TaxID=307937 RepID=A0A9P9FUM9_9HYPO|nr:hypothetical protein EDB81DRAFT_940453 [Dactylonectria macrodidyma]